MSKRSAITLRCLHAFGVQDQLFRTARFCLLIVDFNCSLASTSTMAFQVSVSAISFYLAVFLMRDIFRQPICHNADGFGVVLAVTYWSAIICKGNSKSFSDANPVHTALYRISFSSLICALLFRVGHLLNLGPLRRHVNRGHEHASFLLH